MKITKLPAFIILPIVLGFTGCASTSSHTETVENFTVQRVLILNDNGEMLMSKDRSVWSMPSLVYKDREFIREGIDSLSTSYGIQLSNIEIRGQFSYKYDYQPYATIRNYYVANYAGGELKTPEGFEDARWIPIPEAIEKTTVTSIKQIANQILDYPNTVWGGSFLVSDVGDDHPTAQTEAFYPLFKAK